MKSCMGIQTKSLVMVRFQYLFHHNNLYDGKTFHLSHNTFVY